MTSETYSPTTESELSKQFDQVLEHIMPLINRGEVAAHTEIEKQKQYKYAIADSQQIKEFLLKLGAVRISGPIDQFDEYYLMPGQTPSYTTEALCFRSEKPYVDYLSDTKTDTPDVYSLIYKTNPHYDGSNHNRLIKSITTSDEILALALIDDVHKIRNSSLTPFTVAKTRTQYLYTLPGTQESVHINVDEAVELGNLAEDGGMVKFPVGSFIELSSGELSDENLQSIRELLQLSEEPFNVPYIDKEKFVGKIVTTKMTEVNYIDGDKGVEWLSNTHKPLYYDATNQRFVVGIDPGKFTDYAGVQLETLMNEVHSICAKFDETNDGLEIKSSRASEGTGRSTYERLTAHDGFLHRQNLGQFIDTSVTWSKRVNQILGGRMIFSNVRLTDGKKGIFIHYIGDHDTGYNSWLRRHIK